MNITLHTRLEQDPSLCLLDECLFCLEQENRPLHDGDGGTTHGLAKKIRNHLNRYRPLPKRGMHEKKGT